MSGTEDDPSGLSTIRAFAPSRKDPYMLQAYGGDLKGNVWRFDLSDPDESKWKVELIAKLTDANGKAQPITTGVRIEIDQNNNVDRYLFVGTGKLLGQTDVGDATVSNTLYVIRDGTRTGAGPGAGDALFARRTSTAVDGTKVTGFSGAATGPRLVSGRARQDVEDRHRRRIADVQTVVYAFSKPRPTLARHRCRRRCTRATSPPVTRSSIGRRRRRPEHRHQRRHRRRSG